MRQSEHFSNPSLKSFTHFSNRWSTHKTTFLRDEFWASVRHQLSLLQLQPNTVIDYAASSLTVRTKCRKTCVKITTAGEVQVECKIGKAEFKSKSSRYDTIKESVEQFVLALRQYLNVLS